MTSAPRESELVTCDIQDQIGRVTLNRPPVNALSLEMYDELLAAFRYLRAAPECTVIILRSSCDRAFSAGGDRNETGNEEVSRLRRPRLRELYRLIGEGRQPVVCAVNGAAVGAGASMAACADIRLGTPSTRFIVPEIDFGHAGGASFLRRILPAGLVAHAVLTGAPIGAQAALRCGALNDVVDPDRLWAAADELAALIRGKGADAVANVKEALDVCDNANAHVAYHIEQRFR